MLFMSSVSYTMYPYVQLYILNSTHIMMSERTLRQAFVTNQEVHTKIILFCRKESQETIPADSCSSSSYSLVYIWPLYQFPVPLLSRPVQAETNYTQDTMINNYTYTNHPQWIYYTPIISCEDGSIQPHFISPQGLNRHDPTSNEICHISNTSANYRLFNGRLYHIQTQNGSGNCCTLLIEKLNSASSVAFWSRGRSCFMESPSLS